MSKIVKRRIDSLLLCGSVSLWPNPEQNSPQRHRVTEVAKANQTYRATTPMFAMVAPFVIDGTAQIYKIIPAAGARASNDTLPK